MEETKTIVDEAISNAIELVGNTDLDPKTTTVVILSQIDNMQKCSVEGNLQSISELFLSMLVRMPDMRMSMMVAINAYDKMQEEISNKTKS